MSVRARVCVWMYVRVNAYRPASKTHKKKRDQTNEESQVLLCVCVLNLVSREEKLLQRRGGDENER